MKYLSEYTNEPISQALEEFGGFFAFSNDQFQENAKEGVKYCRVGRSGLIAPKENARALVSRMTEIYKEARAKDIEDHGLEGVIKRELSNYECYYTGDPTEAIEALEPYGITEEQVWEIFRNKEWV